MKEKVKENKYYQIGLTLFLVVIASITFYLVITNIGLLYTYLKLIISFFTPFIIGFVFAFLLNPIVEFCFIYSFIISLLLDSNICIVLPPKINFYG